MALKRAYSYSDIASKTFQTMEFDGEWLNHIGKPERSGSWCIHGLSGHGKTSYEMKLVKYLCGFERVHINTLEEGMRESFKNSLLRYDMKTVANRFTFHSESYEELVKRLDRQRAPKVILIDSLQYFFRRKKLDHYFKLLDRFPTTLFIFISHAKGNDPKGNFADEVQYHSDVKIHVKDFVATVITSRYGGNEPMTIWAEGAHKRQAKLMNNG